MSLLDTLFAIQTIEETESGFTAKLLCHPSHPIYLAHFPNNPITPGACLLRTAGIVLQQKIGRPIYLKSLKNIKYLSLLVPTEEKMVRFDYSHLVETEDGCKTQVVIADETTTYSKMSLTFSYAPV